MYANYLNFLITNEPQNVDLKKLFEQKIANRSFPMKFGDITFDKFEICSDSRGCLIKQGRGRALLNKTTIKKDKNGLFGTQNTNNKKYVLCIIKGTLKISNIEHNISLRIPKSGKVKVSLGFTKQKLIDLKSSTANDDIQKYIEDLGSKLSQFLMPNIKFNEQSQISLISMSVQGGVLHNDGIKRKITNFKQLMTALEEWMSKKGYELKYGVQNTKSLTKGYFKPTLETDLEIKKQMPTIGISDWGSIDYTGVIDLRFVSKMHNYVSNVWNYVLMNRISFGSQQLIKPIVKRPRRNSKTTAQKDRILYNFNKDKHTFKGKKFNCSILKKDEIKSIATSLGINPVGKKEQMCALINAKLPQRKQNFINLRSKLKSLLKN